MRDTEYIGMSVALGRCKFKASHFKQPPVGIAKVNRVHKAAVDVARVLNTAFLQALCYLCTGCTRDVVGDVMQVADVLRIRGLVINARRAHKECD